MPNIDSVEHSSRISISPGSPWSAFADLINRRLEVISDDCRNSSH